MKKIRRTVEIDQEIYEKAMERARYEGSNFAVIIRTMLFNYVEFDPRNENPRKI